MAVGDESSSGDAIAIRFGDFMTNPKSQTVVVIDGGYSGSGEKLVERINSRFGTNHVDLVISTHPDNDHISGLHVVLEKMTVGELWMHQPWKHSTDIKALATDRDVLSELTATKLKKSIETAYDLELLAIEKGIPITEPHTGMTAFSGVIQVLGPSTDFYHSLVCEFGKTSLRSLSEKVKRIVRETWYNDELIDPDEYATSARNNSSTVILANLDGTNVLFTGDAGVEALNHAADYADRIGKPIKTSVHYIQIPHHGSKRNVGPSILNRILGPILPQGTSNGMTSFVSAALKGAPKHPSNKVLNAFVRRGVNVWSPTKGKNHYFHSPDVPQMQNSGSIEILGLQDTYEDEE